jgi:hypothetical protein
MPESLLVQATDPVRSRAVPSLKVPVAVYCLVLPIPTNAMPDGETDIDVRAGAVTLRVADPEIDPTLALMFDEPGLRVLAVPEFEIVATAVLEDVQLTDDRE